MSQLSPPRWVEEKEYGQQCRGPGLSDPMRFVVVVVVVIVVIDVDVVIVIVDGVSDGSFIILIVDSFVVVNFHYCSFYSSIQN